MKTSFESKGHENSFLNKWNYNLWGRHLKKFFVLLNLSGYLSIGFIHYENITLNIIVRNYLRRRFNSNLVMNI